MCPRYFTCNVLRIQVNCDYYDCYDYFYYFHFYLFIYLYFARIRLELQFLETVQTLLRYITRDTPLKFCLLYNVRFYFLNIFLFILLVHIVEFVMSR